MDRRTRVRARVLVTLAAALIAAPAAHAAEPAIVEQPQGVERTQIVRVGWTAETPAPEVIVERRHGLFWVTQASAAAGDVLLAGSDGAWSARWRPGYHAPSGVHRIRVEGEGYALTSDEFRVRPCDCVVPNQVQSKWRDGRFRLRLTAEYGAGPRRGFAALPTKVVTGRPLIRVLRDGRRIGSMRLRYRRGAFRGTWTGPSKPRHAVVFHLVSLRDGFGNG
jgi:hypothetical protein